MTTFFSVPFRAVFFVFAMASLMIPGLATAIQATETVPESDQNPAAEKQDDSASDKKPILNGVDESQFREIEKFFEVLGGGLSESDVSVIGKCFSGRRMAENAESRGVLSFGTGEEREKMFSTFDTSLASSFASWSELMSWDKLRFRSLTATGDGTVEVITRAWDDAIETTTTTRWWIFRTEDGQWKVFDFEDMDLNLRTSTMVGAGVEAVRSGAEWIPKLLALIRLLQSGQGSDGFLEDADDMERIIDDLLEHELPPDIQSFALTLKIGLLQEQENGATESLRLIDQLELVSPTTPIRWYLRASAHLVLENYDQAIQACEQYAAIMGWDSDTCELASDAHFQNGDLVRATEFAILGLEDNPTSWGCLASLAVALPEDRKAELGKHFARIDHDELAIEVVIDWCIESEDWPASDYLFKMLKEHHPESELIGHYAEILGG